MPHLDQETLDRCLWQMANAHDFSTLERLLDAGARDLGGKALDCLVNPMRARVANFDDETLRIIPRLAQSFVAESGVAPTPPLMSAVKGLWPEAFDALLPLSDLQARDPQGDTVAHALLNELGCSERADKACQKMLSALREINPSLEATARTELRMLKSIEDGNVGDVLRLLAQGANVRAFCSDWTPALRAADRGHAPLLKLFLARDRACAHDMDSNRMGLVSLAVCGGNQKCVELALAHADVNLMDLDGDTALSLALANDRWKIVDLVSARSDLNVVDPKGHGPMHWLAWCGIHLPGSIGADHPLDDLAALSQLEVSGETLRALRMLPQIMERLAAPEHAFAPNRAGQTPLDLLNQYEGHPAVGALLKRNMLRAMALKERRLVENSTAPDAPVCSARPRL
jgi:hypothetical protein